MPPTPTGCQTCTAPTADHAQLCQRCVHRLELDLAAVAWLVPELDITRTRQARFTRQSEPARSASTPLPWDDRASRIAHELHTIIALWAAATSVIDEDSRDPLAGVPARTTELARWLRRNLITLRQHPDAGSADRDLTGVTRRARAVLDRPPDLVTYGVCGNTVADRPACGAYLYAAPGKPTITCRRCGAVYDVAARREWMLNYVRSMLGTATEVATYLRWSGVHITSDAIRALKRRGRIHPAAHVPARAGGEPVALYRFADVIEAIGARYQHRPKAKGCA